MDGNIKNLVDCLADLAECKEVVTALIPYSVAQRVYVGTNDQKSSSWLSGSFDLQYILRYSYFAQIHSLYV